MRLEYLPQAVADLRSIEAFLYRIDPDLAARFVADTARAVAAIAERPFSYSPRDALHPGLRSAPLKPYSIYFLPRRDVVEIVRILHQARDLRAKFDR